MKTKKENIRIIGDSLNAMGLEDVAVRLSMEAYALEKEDALAALALVLKEVAVEKRQLLAERLMRNSKIGRPVYLDDLDTRAERELDLHYINELGALNFISNKQNLVIWGSPGTGKTWLAKAIATLSCEKGFRTKWISFPSLYRELKRMQQKEGMALESRFKYYSRFSLLCIDEFPNAEMDEPYLMQEFFDRITEEGNSLLVCSQSSPENWEKLFPVTSFGQSIHGRLLNKALYLKMNGPDLRLISN